MGAGGRPRGPDRPGPPLEPYLTDEEYSDDWTEADEQAWRRTWQWILALWAVALVEWLVIALVVGWL